jgi:hypothetical protein
LRSLGLVKGNIQNEEDAEFGEQREDRSERAKVGKWRRWRLEVELRVRGST